MRSPTLRVSHDRWLEAQQYELDTWKRQHRLHRSLIGWIVSRLRTQKRAIGDDWNHWWYEQFNSYRDVPSQLDRAIELGCGPFTNMRLIMEGRTFGAVVCSDPLVDHYIRFRGFWLASAYAKGRVSIDNHPIEKCPYGPATFDFVALINVLDHVQDAIACVDTALRILRPSGYFVFGQDLTDEEDIARVPFDVGHPIRLHHADLDQQILTQVTPRLHRVLDRQAGRNPSAHYGTYLLVGQKK